MGELLVTIFSTKVAKCYVTFWAILRNVTFQVKTFWPNFGKFWATFYFSFWSHCKRRIAVQIVTCLNGQDVI